MISSIYGRELGGGASYQVVKSAQLSLAKTLAKELAPDKAKEIPEQEPASPFGGD